MVGRRQLLAVWAAVAAVGGPVLIQALLPGPGVAKAPTVEDLQARVEALEARLACVTVASNANKVTFRGCNIHVENGASGTNSTNGFGNLIIGYNEDDLSDAVRTGSHNLVIGPEHTYSSFGGLVAGFANRITGDYASVSGGANNEASGLVAHVSGGNNSKASAQSASVSGGNDNEASGSFAHVSGGAGNKATAFFASVSGGASNQATAQSAHVSGGNGCVVSGADGWGAIAVGGAGAS